MWGLNARGENLIEVSGEGNKKPRFNNYMLQSSYPSPSAPIHNHIEFNHNYLLGNFTIWEHIGIINFGQLFQDNILGSFKDIKIPILIFPNTPNWDTFLTSSGKVSVSKPFLISQCSRGEKGKKGILKNLVKILGICWKRISSCLQSRKTEKKLLWILKGTASSMR